MDIIAFSMSLDRGIKDDSEYEDEEIAYRNIVIACPGKLFREDKLLRHSATRISGREGWLRTKNVGDEGEESGDAVRDSGLESLVGLGVKFVIWAAMFVPKVKSGRLQIDNIRQGQEHKVAKSRTEGMVANKSKMGSAQENEGTQVFAYIILHSSHTGKPSSL